ncbi:MAG: anti-sigma factor [Chloroflexota bacterium]|nr:anti-sigma factor [Chloroflexota bacterium]
MSKQNAQQQPNNMNQTLCEEALALLPAYALGATDADETRLVERALQACPEVAAELVEYQALAVALLHSAPPAQPPAALGERILAAAAASAPAAALPKPTVMTAKPAVTVAKPPAAKRRATPWGWLAAAAAAVALLVTNGYWFTQVQELRMQQADLSAQQDQLSQRLTARNSVIERAAEGQLTRIELTSVDSTSDGLPAAIVLVSPDGTVGAVYTRQLPVLPPEQSYQLWFLDGATGTAVSACVFQVRENGNGQSWLIDVAQPLDLSQIGAMGITIEPAGGSPQPTSDPIAAVEV